MGGALNNTYTIDFITGHIIPSFGAISLFLPENYESNFIDLNVTCSIKGFSENSDTTCKV